MKKVLWVWLGGCMLVCAMAQAADGGAGDAAAAQKLALAKSIYVPVFDQIRYEDVKAQYAEQRKKKGLPAGDMSRKEFEAAKEVIYQTFADALTLEDLQLQKRVAGTAVGQRMLSNIPRSLSGLAPLPLSRDQFTDAEWQAFQDIIQANKEQFVAMTQRMQEFPAVFQKNAKQMQAKLATH